MVALADTAEGTRDGARDGAAARPGVVVAFSGTSALSLPFALDGQPLVVGRAGLAGSLLPDDRLSRSHCTIAFSASTGNWTIKDLGSRNGTFVDGVAVHGEVAVASPRIIRAADTILLPVADVARAKAVVVDGAMVVGARMHEALAALDRAAGSSQTVHVRGESGAGKELAAKRFHERGPHARGPFVAVNCATIPEGLADRLLFGAKRGAYSGADADAIGHVVAADGGVLFLDEGEDLDLQVQAKLLRVIETGDVVALGATRASRVTIRVCLATQRDLRRAVEEGRFRADLYHRIAPPEIALPPLRERLDEIAHHVAGEIALAAPPLSAQAKLVETCMLRHWPGNVRELRRQIRDAALRAAADKETRVRAEHLPETAGQPLVHSRGDDTPKEPPSKTARPYVRRAEQLTREDVVRALAENEGNVSRAAKSLGLQRTQLYREIERHALTHPKKDR